MGASFAATVEGEFVVDLWGGKRDVANELPWEEDTVVCVFSVSKTMTALCALVLVDRGMLSLDDFVTDYWPEYGQNGKASTKVRHVMAHSAGVPDFGEHLTHAELYSWDHVIGVIERQAASWVPGESCKYHALTQGFIIGELVRRISGLSLGEFFRANIAEPLYADFHIGLKSEHFGRVGEMIKGAPMPQRLVRYMRTQHKASPSVRPPVTNSTSFRRAELPSVNGHGNARSIVRVQTAVANGGRAFGVNLIAPSTIDQIFHEQGVIKAMDARHGIGYGLDGPLTRLTPNGTRSTFWVGGGGSFVLLDHTNRVCMAYAMNLMDFDFFGDERGTSLVNAFYKGRG